MTKLFLFTHSCNPSHKAGHDIRTYILSVLLNFYRTSTFTVYVELLAL